MDRRTFVATAGAGLAAATMGSSTKGRPRVQHAVNGERLDANMAALARIGRGPGGYRRMAFTDENIETRQFVAGLMERAGLGVRIDPFGNMLGLRPGTDPNALPILFGSHVDSVPNGGNYDGPVGSLSAIEVAHTLADGDVATQHPLMVTIWSDEEAGLSGSRGFVHGLTREDLETVGPNGRTLEENLRRIGGDPLRTLGAGQDPGSIHAYLELHIEQGAVLHEAGLDIGIVEGIVGIHWYDVTFTGVPNHAGTTPMDRRHNAMLASADLTLAVERIIRAEPGRHVGTVGRLEVVPNAPNVVPGRVDLTVEIRDLSSEKIAMLWERIRQAAEAAARRFDVQFSFSQRFDLVPAISDPAVRGAIAESVEELGFSSQVMPSGAGHDAQELAVLGPMGMIFVPSVGGVSHSPREFTRPEDIVNGANVLLHTVLRLDG